MNSLARGQLQLIPRSTGDVHIGLSSEVKGDFGLQGISVLEFVNEDMGIPGLEIATGLFIAPQQAASPYQQVIRGGYTVGFCGLPSTGRRTPLSVRAVRDLPVPYESSAEMTGRFAEMIL